MAIYRTRIPPSGPPLEIHVPDGPGGSCSPQPGWLWVNAGTTTLPLDQDGSLCKPFATLQQAVNTAIAAPAVPGWTIRVAAGEYTESGTLDLTGVAAPLAFELGGATLNCAVIAAGPSVLLSDGNVVGQTTVNTARFEAYRFQSLGGYVAGGSAAEAFFRDQSHCSGDTNLPGVTVVVEHSNHANVIASSCRASGGADALGCTISAGTITTTFQAFGCQLAAIGNPIVAQSFAIRDCNIAGDLTATGENQTSRLEDCVWLSPTRSLIGPATATFLLDAWTYGDATKNAVAVIDASLRVQPGAVQPPIEHGNFGASQAFDFQASANQSGTLDANCSFTFGTHPPPGTEVNIDITEDGVGGHTMTWPGTVIWLGGSAPTPAAANTISRAKGFWNGTIYKLAWLSPYGV